MGAFKASDAERYGGQGGGGYFSLKNDKDVARVRFMYDNIDDVIGYAVHEVEVDGKKRYVNCLRSYGDPIDDCPFCKAHKFQAAKLFVPLYNEDTERVEMWERGKKFFAKLTSLCARYDHLVSHVFEIERNGKPGSTQTTYEIYPVTEDDITLDDLPEVQKIIGGIVLDKTAEEMQTYLDTGYFPDTEAEQPVRRSARREGSEESSEFRRRTPVNRGRSDRDRF